MSRVTPGFPPSGRLVQAFTQSDLSPLLTATSAPLGPAVSASSQSRFSCMVVWTGYARKRPKRTATNAVAKLKTSKFTIGKRDTGATQKFTKLH